MENDMENEIYSEFRLFPLSKKAKCQATFYFALKCEIKKRPYLVIGILMISTIVYLGLAMRTFEMFHFFFFMLNFFISSYLPNQNAAGSFDFTYLANSMWLIIITMTTVGFGEGYPSTHLGRFIAVIACIIGMLLVSLMVVSLTVSSEFSPEEEKVDHHFIKFLRIIIKRLFMF